MTPHRTGWTVHDGKAGGRAGYSTNLAQRTPRTALGVTIVSTYPGKAAVTSTAVFPQVQHNYPSQTCAIARTRCHRGATNVSGVTKLR